MQRTLSTRSLTVRFASLSALACIVCGTAAASHAADVSVAVAANFSAPMAKIAQSFSQDTGHKALLSIGATGKFYAQIKNGAPFEILLAADQETPAKLEQEGLAIAGSRFTYAVGRLVLWSKQSALVDDKGDILRKGNFDKLAIADPKLAPYGAAAVEVLDQLGLRQSLSAKLVQGENIATAYQWVNAETANMGFVALSQVMVDGKIAEGSAWLVPPSLHAPIRQDAIALAKGKGNPAVPALLDYLRGEKARTIIKSFGYAF